jgi:hypothetical protein
MTTQEMFNEILQNAESKPWEVFQTLQYSTSECDICKSKLGGFRHYTRGLIIRDKSLVVNGVERLHRKISKPVFLLCQTCLDKLIDKTYGITHGQEG